MFASRTSPGLIITVRRDGAVVPRVRVEVTRAQRNSLGEIVWLPVGAEVTDENGHAEFPTIAGRYFGSASTEAARAVQFIDVSIANEPTWATIDLQPLTPFAGQIVDAKTKQPIPLAIVTAEPQPDARGDAPTIEVVSANSDSLGRVSLFLPPFPRWNVRARAQGYLSSRIQIESAPFAIELERGVRLEGTVIDETRAAIPNATVRLSPADVAFLTTGDEGHFAVTIPRRAVSLHAAAPNGRQLLTRFTPRENSEVERVTLIVADGSALTGIVRDSNGPVADAEVRVLAEPDSLEVASLQTDSRGRFEAKSLPEGRYSVHANHGPGRRVNAVGIELPGAAPLELTLPDASTITGIVNGADGQPASGALVTLQWTKRLNEVPRTARTGTDGRFEFENVLAGSASVFAELGELKSPEEPAYVAPGGTTDVTLHCMAQGTIIGTVDTDEPIKNVLVRSDNEAFNEMANVNDGGFEVTLIVGGRFVEGGVADVEPNAVTRVQVRALHSIPQNEMHPEPGSGISFENAAGGVQMGELITSINGEPRGDARAAFATTTVLQVRCDGRDLQFTLK